jgi:hypothetical protein
MPDGHVFGDTLHALARDSPTRSGRAGLVRRLPINATLRIRAVIDPPRTRLRQSMAAHPAVKSLSR